MRNYFSSNQPAFSEYKQNTDAARLLKLAKSYSDKSDIVPAAIFSGVALEKLLEEICLKVGLITQEFVDQNTSSQINNYTQKLSVGNDKLKIRSIDTSKLAAYCKQRNASLHGSWGDLDTLAVSQMIDYLERFRKRMLEKTAIQNESSPIDVGDEGALADESVQSENSAITSQVENTHQPIKNEGAVTPNERKKIQKTFKKLLDNQKSLLGGSGKPLRFLIYATLMGTWRDENTYDTELLEEIFGEDWQELANQIKSLDSSIFTYSAGVWQLHHRVELWRLVATHITDQQINEFVSFALRVLNASHNNLPSPENIQVISYSNRNFDYSHELRQGVSEGLVLLANEQVEKMICSNNQPQACSSRVLDEVLNDLNWQRLASLNEILPTLAKVHPNLFLNKMEDAFKNANLRDRFSLNEAGSILGGEYLTNLITALEWLAWNKDFFARSIALLVRLAQLGFNEGVSYAPLNTLTTIFLAWLPQTNASIILIKTTISKLVKEHPKLGWELLLKLLPNNTTFSTGTTERKLIISEVQDLQDHYSNLAVNESKQDQTKLLVLIQQLNRITPNGLDNFLEYLSELSDRNLEYDYKSQIWEQLGTLIRNNDQYSDADWSFSDEEISRMKLIHNKFDPKDIIINAKQLFIEVEFDLYDGEGSYDEQRKRLDEKRSKAINEIYQEKELKTVIKFAQQVEDSHAVGKSLATISDKNIDNYLLPTFVVSEDDKIRRFIGSFVWQKYNQNLNEWLETLNYSEWTAEQIGQFFAYLPLTKYIWELAEKTLGSNMSYYWQHVNTLTIERESHSSYAIDKLLDHNRFDEALVCIHLLYYKKINFDVKQCIKVLQNVYSNNHRNSSLHNYHIVELIKRLQSENPTDLSQLYDIEWRHIGLLQDKKRNEKPYFLEKKLSSDPDFFYKVLRCGFRLKQDEDSKKDLFENENITPSNCVQLLYNWELSPGYINGNSFSGEQCCEWYQKVMEFCATSGYSQSANLIIGEVFFHAPKDPDGVWIHHDVAGILDVIDCQEIRSGYISRYYKVRGAQIVDPTGEKERKEAGVFVAKAEELDNAGFPNFAVTMRELAARIESDINRYR